jgi:phage terminase small subunit
VSERSLTDKQQRFVEEYLIDLNATQAAIRAGYSARTANEQGAQLLAKLSVQEAVSAAQAERSARIGLHQDRVLEELAAIAFAKMGDFAEWTGESVEMKDSANLDTRAVQEVSQKHTRYGTNVGIKLHDKVATLKLLGQHIGMFTEKHEVRGKIEHTVTIESIRRAIGLVS